MVSQAVMKKCWKNKSPSPRSTVPSLIFLNQSLVSQSWTAWCLGTPRTSQCTTRGGILTSLTLPSGSVASHYACEQYTPAESEDQLRKYLSLNFLLVRYLVNYKFQRWCSICIYPCSLLLISLSFPNLINTHTFSFPNGRRDWGNPLAWVRGALKAASETLSLIAIIRSSHLD